MTGFWFWTDWEDVRSTKMIQNLHRTGRQPADTQLSQWWKLTTIKGSPLTYCLSSSRLTRTQSPPRTIRTVCCHLTGVADGSGVLVEPAEPISSSGCNISADLYKISAYECRYMKIRSIISMFLCLHGTNGCSLTGRCYWDRFCITHTNLCLEIITQQLQVQLNIYSH